MKEYIIEAGNTLVPMVLALRSLGFRVSRRSDPDPDKDLWRAESDEWGVAASELPTLLALVLMRQVRGPDWKAADEEIDAVLAEFGGI